MPGNISRFTQHTEVLKCIEQLETSFGKGGARLVVSDVVDGEGHQYVNLVQKGGGVLGVALVGYTYILEKMGIRFIRLAGTSAGTINTALMTVMCSGNEGGKVKGSKKEKKSEAVLQAMDNLDFFKLVDGHPVARFLIKRFIKSPEFGKRLSIWAKSLAIGLVALTALSLILLSLRYWVDALFGPARVIFIITLAYYGVVGLLGFYAGYLLRRLKTAGFGINPGNYFLQWIEDRLKDNGVQTVTDLMNVAETPVKDLRLREGVEGNTDGLQGDVTFITSELVTQNKIEFPKMWNLFANDKDTLNPAGFVRSSMAIPLFFESYFIRNIPCNTDDVKQAWMAELGETEPPSEARFVDGGILSNFPINLFYNPAVVGKPRLPSLGIDLDDTISPAAFFAQEHPGDLVEANRNAAGSAKTISDMQDGSMSAESWSLGGYLYRIFNTIRFYYDKDFLIKNQFYRKGIGTIPLKGFGWLNFFLSDADKINMFVLGARSATRFLQDFDWDAYKNQRAEMQKKLAHPEA